MNQEGGPDMSRRRFLTGAAKLGAGAMLVKAGITGAEAQEAKLETQESRVPTAEQIAAMTKGAVEKARKEGARFTPATVIAELQTRIFGNQNPAAGIETFDNEKMYLATPVQKEAKDAYNTFMVHSDSYIQAAEKAIAAAEPSQLDALGREAQRLKAPSIIPIADNGFLREQDPVRDAEGVRDAALRLARANDALLSSSKR